MKNGYGNIKRPALLCLFKAIMRSSGALSVMWPMVLFLVSPD